MAHQRIVLAVQDAARSLSVNRATIYALHAIDPTFPRIFKVAGRKSGILAYELETWIAARRSGHRIDGKRETEK